MSEEGTLFEFDGSSAGESCPRERFGRYVDVRELARGGMGAIFRAIDPALDRPVAIKVLLGSSPPSESETARFLREAKVTGGLQHPNIPPIHEVGRTDDGRPYLVMKLIEGQSLDVALADRPATLDRRRLIGALVKVCEALAYAHDRGVVHRDLKPANIMIGEFGEVLVMDWGIARVAGAEDEASGPTGGGRAIVADRQLTVDGAVMGTPAYMPPEQASGDVEGIDGRSDVYSLGAVLYEIVAGQRPFDGGSAGKVMAEIIGGRLVPPADRRADVPADLNAIVLKAMSLAVDDRYPSVVALKEDLEAYLEHRPVTAARYAPWQRAFKWVRRHRTASIGIAATLFALVAGVGATIVRQRSATAAEVERLLGLAEERTTEGDHAEARDALTQVLALDPDNERARGDLGPVAARAEASRQAAARSREVARRAAALETEWAAVGFASAPTADTRREWYAARAAVVEKARQLLELGDDASARQILAAAALSAADQAEADGDWELAGLMIEQAGRVLLPDRLAAERTELQEARERQRRDDVATVEGILETVAGEPPAKGMLDEYATRIARRPRPHVVRLLIPAVVSDSPWVRRVAIESLGRIGDPTTEAPVDRTRFEPDLSGSAVLDERQRPMLERLGARLLASWTGASRRPALDAVEVLSLRLLPLGLEEADGQEAVAIAWALARLGDPRAYVVVDRKRIAAGTQSLFWHNTSLPYGWMTGPGSGPDAGEPETAAEWSNRAVRRWSRDDLDGALADLDRAIEIEPTDVRYRINRASVLDELGRREDALAELGEAIGQAPDEPSAHRLRGAILSRLGRHDEAVESFELALRLGDESAAARTGLASARLGAGDLEGALAELAIAHRLDPESLRVLLLRARVHRKSGHLEAARADLDQALDLDPRHLEALHRRAEVRERTGDWRGALDDLSAALSIDPSSALTLVLRADARLELGDRHGARVDLEEALALDPENAKAHNTLGTIAYRDGDLEAALAAYERAIEIDRTDDIFWFNRALTRKRLGDPKGAIDDYTEALRLEPRSIEALAGRAGARDLLGDVQGAYDDYTRALRLAPGNAEILDDRACFLRRHGHRERALEDHEAALALDPGNGAFLNNRGITRREMGDLEGAIEDYGRSIGADPSDPIAYSNRATTYEELGRFDRAIEDYSTVLRLDPDNSITRARRGLARIAAGDPTGLEDADEAVRRSPEAPEPLALRAVAHVELERWDEAEADLLGAFRLDEEFPPVLKAALLPLLESKDYARIDRVLGSFRQMIPEHLEEETQVLTRLLEHRLARDRDE